MMCVCGGEYDPAEGLELCVQCGRQCPLDQWMSWHAHIVNPRQKEQDDRLDYAERSVT